MNVRDRWFALFGVNAVNATMNAIFAFGGSLFALALAVVSGATAWWCFHMGRKCRVVPVVDNTRLCSTDPDYMTRKEEVELSARRTL